jgi:hypothetical protein
MLFPDIDAAAGTVTLAIWQSALFAGMALLLLFLAIYRGKWPDVAGTVVRVGLVMFAVAAVWGLLAQLSEHDRADERRALDRRIAEMGARALAPGSPLGCLEPTLGATLEAACEKAVFADPQSVAGTMAYVAGSLSLLSDSLAWGLDPDYDSGLAALRRRLEIDRFGLVAQVLVGQGCSAAKCETLALFADASRLSANLKARTFENLVARHSAGWPQPPPAAAPEAAAPAVPPAPVATAPPAPTPAPSAGSGINFPSAASIPPVSIMTEEPSQPANPAAAASAPGPAAPKRPPGAPPRSPPRAQAPPTAPPIQIAPPAANAGTEPNPQ